MQDKDRTKLNSILKALKSGEISISDTKSILENRKKPEEKDFGINSRISTSTKTCAKEVSASENGIAIIGMSGQFPKSKTLHEFWNNIANGIDCISEVPPERWPAEKYYDADANVPGKTYCKWQGVLEDVDKFDPLFFNISPIEAEIMDPQQRLILESCWGCIEDAGINPQSLSETKCGVFVGCGVSDYGQQGDGQELNAYGLMGSSPSILAARISYILNLKGPCMAIDTACSSSLVAISEACNSLMLNTSDIALAGGVHIMLSPAGFVMASKAGMLSPSGRCHTFDARADGFVPGEGVGVVLLKRLSDAIRDRNPIYGVIRGWGVNHDGKTNGITAPSANSQIELEKEVYRRFGINPETITMAEAHGTGTKLGDPIEIEALTESFQHFTNKKNYCALGSVKSNIGHSVKAAGVAGLIKILLSLKNKMIPPTINFENLNEHIYLENSPFYINTQLKPWETAPGQLRRACISSFGFSGTNAHLVIEEYASQNEIKDSASVINSNNPGLFVLSAKKEESLIEYADRLKNWLESKKDINIEELAYTFQVGRDAMDFRLAVIAESREQLIEELAGVISGHPSERVFTGRAKRKKSVEEINEEKEILAAVKTWIKDKNFSGLAKAFVKGVNIHWDMLYDDDKRPRSIHAPTYPFKRERYWNCQGNTEANEPLDTTTGLKALHPLLHQNTSDLYHNRYTSIFTGDEFFLKGHVVKEKRIMPGVAYLEMARAAAEMLSGDFSKAQITLKNVVWVHPIIVEKTPAKVDINLSEDNNSEFAFKVYSDVEAADENSKLHCQGKILFNEKSGERPVLNLEELKCQTNVKRISSEQCYQVFSELGIEYGQEFKGIESVFVGKEMALAKLVLPSSVSSTKEEFGLHPSILDAALQASVALVMGTDNQKFALPFELQQLNVFSKSTSNMWALIRYSNDSNSSGKIQRLDIDLCDEQGLVCAQIKGLTSKGPETTNVDDMNPSDMDTVMIYPSWIEQPSTGKGHMPSLYKHIAVFCEIPQLSDEGCVAGMDGIETFILDSKHKDIDKRFEEYSIQIFEIIQRVLKEKPKDKVLFQIVVQPTGEKKLFWALSALLKTARLEYSKFIGQMIGIESDESLDEIYNKINVNKFNLNNKEIKYQDGRRFVCQWTQLDKPEQVESMPWRDNGVYLITGGAGKLGLIFSKEIAERVENPILILTGRSPLNESRLKELEELEKLGATVRYHQMNVANRQDVRMVIQSIKNQYGNINGIIHAAGLIQDNFIVKKTQKELKNVLAPKVTGLVNMDLESKDMNLDFILLFSSGAGAMGNMGQIDYSAANAFMDQFASYRNELVSSKQRYGRTLAINWPLWKSGGLHVDEENEKLVMRNTGMVAMKSSRGIKAFYRCFSSTKEQIMVLEGRYKMLKDKINAINDSEGVQALNSTPLKEARVVIDKDNLFEKVQTDLAKTVSMLLKVKIQDIDLEGELSEYGFDSISLTQFINKLNEQYKLELAPTIFFEYSTLHSFAKYLTDEYEEVLASKFGVRKVVDVPVQEKETDVEKYVYIKEESVHMDKRMEKYKLIQETPTSKRIHREQEPIAIVGISGIFPQSKDIDMFWDNLVNGRDCITEIPKERWDYKEYYGDPSKEDNKTNVKWGGFIEAVDEFDPLFFGISPQEAKLMDPQQRLLMMYAWKAIEDAGYSAQSISGSKTGMFIGTANTGYSQLICRANLPIEGYTATGLSISVGPNRMSYFLNIHGPSEPIETACSSSLIAIHRAVSAIKDGSCDMALAGGVNTLVSPDAHISFSKAGMLCEDGRCKTFSDKANGYVRGEGAGILFLKRLSDAEKAGDHIYGVILGTAENHGGRANSLTAPNPKAQAELIKTAYTNAGVDPRTVTYIEAHGTGTELGDPIEINGLKMAFRDLYKETGDSEVTSRHCGLGSVKSNIGHLELAAGIAGVVKVLLQMKYKTLVKSLHTETINPYIQLEDSPFYIVNEKKEWKALKDDSGNDIPRRAGVSSFGFGGANCHIVLEEYIPKACNCSKNLQNSGEPYIIILSARNEERLNEQANQLLEAISKPQFEENDIVNMAYTLQVGRDAMEERIAIVVKTVEELKEKLKAFIEGQQDIDDFYRGQVKSSKKALDIFAGDEDIQKAIENWVIKKKYSKIAELWTKGFDIKWNLLYCDAELHRISLPTYPFAKEKYWVPVSGNKMIGNMESKTTLPIMTIPESNKSEEKVSSVSSKPVQINLESNTFDSLKYVKSVVKELLGMVSETLINPGQQLSKYGMNYTLAIKLQDRIKKDLNIEIDGKRFIDKFTVNELVNQIDEVRKPQGNPVANQTVSVQTFETEKEQPKKVEEEKVCQNKNNSFDVKQYVEQIIRELLGLSSDTQIEPEEQLSKYGMDSISAIKLQDRVKNDLKIELDGRRFVEKFTMNEVVEQIKELQKLQNCPTKEQKTPNTETTFETVKEQTKKVEDEKPCGEENNSFDVKQYVEQITRELLGLSSNTQIEPEEQLSKYGMDSISAIKLQDRVKNDLKIELDGRRFVEKFTMAEVVEQIKELQKLQNCPRKEQSTPVPILTEDKELPEQKTSLEKIQNIGETEDIKKSQRPVTTASNNSLSPWELDRKLPEGLSLGQNAVPFKHSFVKEKVFLTGVTGLFGAFLCGEILRSTSTSVYCLIRAESEVSGLKRIEENLRKYNLWSEGYKTRVFPVLGDLNEERMGISMDVYEELSKEIEAIYHCGALVNHVLNYSQMKTANVDGTISIIKFAGNLKIKPIHFISSTGVCIRTGDDNLLLPAYTEENLLEDGRYLTNGYSQTKWVSEHHMMQAHERGIPVTIMRCGQVTGTSDKCVGIAVDMLHRFLKIFSELQYTPAWDDGVIDVTPIDYISQAVLAISQKNDCYGKIYNLINPKPIPIKEFFGYLRKKNTTMSEIPYQQWVEYCQKYIESLPESNKRTVLLDFFIKRGATGYRLFEVYYFRYQGLMNSNTHAALEDTGIEFPVLDETWWNQFLKQLALLD